MAFRCLLAQRFWLLLTDEEDDDEDDDDGGSGGGQIVNRDRTEAGSRQGPRFVFVCYVKYESLHTFVCLECYARICMRACECVHFCVHFSVHTRLHRGVAVGYSLTVV